MSLAGRDPPASPANAQEAIVYIVFFRAIDCGGQPRSGAGRVESRCVGLHSFLSPATLPCDFCVVDQFFVL